MIDKPARGAAPCQPVLQTAAISNLTCPERLWLLSACLCLLEILLVFFFFGSRLRLRANLCSVPSCSWWFKPRDGSSSFWKWPAGAAAMGAPAASRSEAARGLRMRWGALGGGCRGPCRSLPCPSFWPTFSCCSPFRARPSRVSHPMKQRRGRWRREEAVPWAALPLWCSQYRNLLASQVAATPRLCLGMQSPESNQQKKQACTSPRLQHVAPPWVFPPSNITKIPPLLQTTQEREPQTLTEMFIKIELQNNRSEHNGSWSRIALNWFFLLLLLFSTRKWKKNKSRLYKKNRKCRTQ